jgi:hypothetical protein
MSKAFLLASSLALISTSALAQLNNQFGTSSNSPKIYSSDGTYLGNLNSNRFDPNSVSNPYGRDGSPYSSDSINNPYGRYGSPYSPQGVRNPYGN